MITFFRKDAADDAFIQNEILRQRAMLGIRARKLPRAPRFILPDPVERQYRKFLLSIVRNIEQQTKNLVFIALPGLVIERDQGLLRNDDDDAETTSRKKQMRENVRTAIRNGSIKRKPCQVCGERAEAHHEDYRKPLKIIWLCHKHNMERNRTDDGSFRADAWAEDAERVIDTLRLNVQANEPIVPSVLAADIGQKTSAWNDRQWRKTMRSVLGVDILTQEPWLNDMTVSFTKQNVALIKSITDQSVTDIEGFVQRGLADGSSHSVIRKQIQEQFRATRKRATLIARDQVSKLNGQITKARQQEAGIEKYRWRTSLDERVRGRPGGRYPRSRYNHWTREGKIFSWNKPPPDGHPGMPIQCRCTAEPVFEEIERLIEKEKPEPVVKRKKRIPADILAVRKFEKVIRGRTVNEVGAAIDKSGKVVLSKIGAKDYIKFTDSEMQIIRNKILTHNHPTGYSFSVDDIRLSAGSQLKEIRAVGEKYSYSMKPPATGWDEKFYKEKIVPAHRSADKSTRIEFWNKIRNKEITIEEANLEHAHKVWQRVAIHTGVIYERKLL